jgi:DNA-binding response OmpR family regulator
VSAREEELARLRVVIVDDTDDIRLLLRLQLVRDARFEVVGEGADGEEAITLAETVQPDLVILDRQMPKLDGVKAIPEIRRVAPDAAIVLYTAQSDPTTYEAAIDAGALEVLGKAGPSFVDQLVDALHRRSATTAATITVRIGPVSSEAARVWVANTRKIIDAVASNPHVLAEPVPPDIFDIFRSFLDQWGGVAESTDEFRWVAKADATDVTRVVTHWGAIDAMTDEQLDELGVHWSPPEGESFFHALTTGVLEALNRHEETRRLAMRLGVQFASYQRRD